MTPATRAPSLVALALAVLGASACSGAKQPISNNPDRGRILFQQNCAVCHSTGKETRPGAGQGPILAGVVGRPAASVPNFGYTKALKASHLTWDAATLGRFLVGPAAMVPGTAMVITVPDPADRSNLIAFLATLPAVAFPTAAQLAALPHAAPSPGDWTNDAPGVCHSVHVADLPPPFVSESAQNGPQTSDRPEGAILSVPSGFQVRSFASGLSGPRLLRKAPNGDIFIAETKRGRIRVLRAADGADAPSENTIFADDLSGPFGIAFYPLGDDPQWVYVANLNSVVRFPYRNGDLQARGPAEVIVPHLADSTGGHSTRDVAFSLDGRRLFISVGSGSNVADGMPLKTPGEIRAWEATHAVGSAWGNEAARADVLVTDPEGQGHVRIFATGIRNAVGLCIQPGTGALWASTNERDALGDNLVPDYVTHVQEGAFYGWPWYYMGNHEDPRHAGERPDLAGRATVPDVLFQSHSAPLEMTFYPEDATGTSAFPAEYRGDAFVALHGSWNRSVRTGNKVVRVLLRNGVPTGEYEDFLTGFVVDNGHVWGRPVGVTVARDGALLVTDDANDTLWRISYAGK